MDNSKDTWQILFKGEILTGFEPLKVKLNCMKMMSISLEKAEQLFCGRKVILRKGLDQERRDKYENLFREQGMRVYFVKENDLSEQKHPVTLTTPHKQKSSEQLQMLELEPSAQTKPQDNTASNTITKITPSDSSSFGMLDLEIVTPRPSQNKTEKHDSTADTTQTDNTTKGKSSNEAGFASSSLADKFEFFNDQDKVTERPPFFGIQTEGRFDQISYITATFICSLTSWWLIFVSILFSASLILVIPVYLAFIRIQILRLHDLNLPWYWVMIHPIVNLLIVLVTLEGGFSSLITWHYLTISMAYSMVPWRSLTFVAALINSLFFIFMSIKRGSLGENDYGAPVVDLVATQEEGNKFLSGSVIGMVFSCVLLLSIVLLRPASPNAGGLPLTVQQLNAHTPRSGEFIQFDAYVAWHASDCTCSPFDYTCLPCTEGVAIFSDKKPSDTLDMQTHYDLINGRNKEGHKEYILIMDPPDNIKAGKKYRFTVYSSAQAGSSKYTISHQVK